jgi:hypothetical protein
MAPTALPLQEAAALTHGQSQKSNERRRFSSRDGFETSIESFSDVDFQGAKSALLALAFQERIEPQCPSKVVDAWTINKEFKFLDFGDANTK